MILKTNEALMYLKQAIKSVTRFTFITKNVHVHVVHRKFVRLIAFVMQAKKTKRSLKTG